MSDHIETDIKTLRAELDDLRGDLKRIAATLQVLVRHGQAEASPRLEELCRDLPDDIKRIATEAKQHIEAKPLGSALTSFGIGMLLGMILNGRRP